MDHRKAKHLSFLVNRHVLSLFVLISILPSALLSTGLGQDIPRYEFNGFRGNLKRAYYISANKANRSHPAYKILDGEVILDSYAFDHLHHRGPPEQISTKPCATPSVA